MSDILHDLTELTENPSVLDYCETLLIKDAMKEIKSMRQCIRYVVDAYLLGNEYSDGHKQLILSEKWYKFAKKLIMEND